MINLCNDTVDFDWLLDCKQQDMKHNLLISADGFDEIQTTIPCLLQRAFLPLPTVVTFVSALCLHYFVHFRSLVSSFRKMVPTHLKACDTLVPLWAHCAGLLRRSLPATKMEYATPHISAVCVLRCPCPALGL